MYARINDYIHNKFSLQSCLSNQHSICNGKIKIQSTIPAQNLIDMLSRNGRKQIYYDLKCTHWHNISHFISQITISTILLSNVLHTKVEPERSCQICILSIFGSGCTNWMNCISATTSTTFKCLDTADQSINLILNMLPKLKNRSVFSWVYL